MTWWEWALVILGAWFLIGLVFGLALGKITHRMED